MSVMECAIVFNEPRCFAPTRVATGEMKMDHFKQRLRGNIKQMIAGHNYANFKELYQRAVKIARDIEETEAENKKSNLGKRKLNAKGSSFQRN